jgi:hypothetical protein
MGTVWWPGWDIVIANPRQFADGEAIQKRDSIPPGLLRRRRMPPPRNDRRATNRRLLLVGRATSAGQQGNFCWLAGRNLVVSRAKSGGPCGASSLRTRRVKQSRSGIASPLDCFVVGECRLLAMTGEQRTGDFCWSLRGIVIANPKGEAIQKRDGIPTGLLRRRRMPPPRNDTNLDPQNHARNSR